MKKSILKKIISFILAISIISTLAISVSAKKQEASAYDVEIDGVVINVINDNGTRTVTYTDEDGTYTFIYDGETLQMNTPEGAYSATISSEDVTADASSNELQAMAASSNSYISNSCCEYSYGLNTCSGYAGGVFCTPTDNKIVSMFSVTDSVRMGYIDNFCDAVDDDDYNYTCAVASLGVSIVFQVITMLAAAGGYTAIAISAIFLSLGLQTSCIIYFSGMDEAEKKAERYFALIY